MHFDPAAAARLAQLADAVDTSTDAEDLQDTLARLTDQASSTVKSFVGLSVLRGPDRAAVLTVLEPGSGEVRTSLTLPGASSAADDLVVVLHATWPDAFVQLADQLGLLTDDGHEIDLGVDAALADGTSALPAASVLNQAIGVLLARGLTPTEAQTELADDDTLDAARRLLGSIDGSEPGRGV